MLEPSTTMLARVRCLATGAAIGVGASAASSYLADNPLVMTQLKRKLSEAGGGSGSEKEEKPPLVCVVKMSGQIAAPAPGGLGARQTISLSAFEPVLEQAFKVEPRCVVLELNSPGGSPAQSSLLHSRLQQLRKKHPDVELLCYTTDVCASGGCGRRLPEYAAASAIQRRAASLQVLHRLRVRRDLCPPLEHRRLDRRRLAVGRAGRAAPQVGRGGPHAHRRPPGRHLSDAPPRHLPHLQTHLKHTPSRLAPHHPDAPQDAPPRVSQTPRTAPVPDGERSTAAGTSKAGDSPLRARDPVEVRKKEMLLEELHADFKAKVEAARGSRLKHYEAATYHRAAGEISRDQPR